MLGHYEQQQSIYLAKIVENANEKHLKQSRLRNHKSLFNLLKILSSYKQFANHQMRQQLKTRLYNRIIMITKYFNPQSYEQWIDAINSIDRFTSSEFSEQFNNEKSTDQHKSQIQTRQNNNHNVHHKASIHELMFTEKEDDGKNETISDFENKTRNKFWVENKHHKNYHSFLSHNSHNLVANTSKNTYSQIEFRGKGRKFNSNLHYISFEPSENIFEENKENMALEDNQPTRTPFSRSFIHNLPTSNGSPFVLSKITNNTKDATLDESEEQDMQQWKTMLSRAQIFHQINIKFKAFSALIANCEAFGEYRELRQRAKLFHQHNTYSKIWHILYNYARNKKAEKNLQKIVRMDYQQKTLRKCFKILNVNYNLKIEIEKKKDYQSRIQSLNFIGCEFLCHLLFKCSQIDVDENDQIYSTPKSIRMKANHFEDTLDSQKMELLLEYFGRNSISRSVINRIFELKRLSVLKKCFGGFTQNLKESEQKYEKCVMLVKRGILKKFMLSTYSKMADNSSNAYVTAIRSNQLKQKIFKAMRQISLSHKIYDKKVLYIRNKTVLSKKQQIMEIWKQRCLRRLQNKLDLSIRVSKNCQMIKRVFRKKYFNTLLTINQRYTEQEAEAQSLRQISLMKSIFNELKIRAHQRRTYNKIKNKKKYQQLDNLFKHWRQKMRGKKLHSHLVNFINSVMFGSIRRYSCLLEKEEKIREINKQSKFLYGLKKMKLFHLAYQKLEHQKIKTVERTLLFQNLCKFRQIVKNDIAKNKYDRHTKQISYNSTLTNERIRQKSLSQFLTKIKSTTSEIKSYTRKKQQLMSLLNPQFQIVTKISKSSDNGKQAKQQIYQLRNPVRQKLAFFNLLNAELDEKKNTEKLRKQIFQKSAEAMIGNQKRQLDFLAKNTLVQKKVSKDRIKTEFDFLKQFLTKNLECTKQRYRNALQIYQKRILYGCLEVFTIRVAKRSQQIFTLREKISSMRKHSMAKKLINNFKSIRILHKKQKQVIKKRGFKKFLTRIEKYKYVKDVLQKSSDLQFRVYSKRFMQQLLQASILKEYKEKTEYRVKDCQRKIFTMRMQSNIMNKQIERKASYMALKFHAIRVQRLAFKALSLGKKKDEKVCSILIQDGKQHQFTTKRLRIYEHISTEYSSI